MKKILLPKGKYTIVDDEDFIKYGNLKWYIAIGNYVRRDGYVKKSYRSDKKHGLRYPTFLHRLITNCPKRCEVDHINGDTLDNRKQNLRLCTRVQNARNTKIRNVNKSGYVGVSWDKNVKKWRAAINSYPRKFLGNFNDIKEAAEAYRNEAKKRYGEFYKQ